jgi:excisionase family DNA binding protein
MTPTRSPAARRLTFSPQPDPGYARRLELAADGTMSVAEAAAFLGVSRGKVYLLLEAGELASVPIGTQRVIPKRAVVEYLAARMMNAD